MEEEIYNILWIDDEHEKLSGLKGRARRNGINLIPFKSLKRGVSELERNYPYYDGILLDAKFFEDEDDESGTEDTDNVHRAKERILQLPKKFEIFILTGQAEAFEDKTFKKAFSHVYVKGRDKDINQLFIEIKESAKKQPDTQIRQNYKRVFEVCTARYIGENTGQDLLNLLKSDDATGIDDHFNTIRKIVEDIFIAFNKFNLLPVEFINPEVAINQSSIFLSGNEQNEKANEIYKQYIHLDETHLPAQISNCLRNILFVTQPGSHRSIIDQHVNAVKTPYLLKSTLLQLMDVMIWFKLYLDSKPKPENWIKKQNEFEINEPYQIELIKGKVININLLKGFAFFEPEDCSGNIFIPPHFVAEHSLENHMPVSVETEKYTDNRTGELKIRVKRIELIQP